MDCIMQNDFGLKVDTPPEEVSALLMGAIRERLYLLIQGHLMNSFHNIIRYRVQLHL